MNFAIAGLGYIAEKHIAVIKDLGGDLKCAVDPFYPNGILDKYFLDCTYTKSWSVFEAYLHSMEIEYLVICSPSFLHHEHILAGQRAGCKIICEKPLFHSLYPVKEIKGEVYTILQLRYSKYVDMIKPIGNHIYITYHTPRGNWYSHSWKKDPELSGGLLMNIGVHLFDLMLHKYGVNFDRLRLYKNNETEATGSFMIGDISIFWDLSIDKSKQMVRDINSVRLFDANDPIGTENLHKKAYLEIMKGEGIEVKDALHSLRLVEAYNQMEPEYKSKDSGFINSI